MGKAGKDSKMPRDLRDLEKAWAKAPTLKEFRDGSAKPRRVREKVFRAIVENVGANSHSGIIRVIELDSLTGKKGNFRQVICWQKNGKRRVFSCLTKESLAKKYRIVVAVGRLRTHD